MKQTPPFRRIKIESFILFFAWIFVTYSCTESGDSIHPEVKNITESVYASGFIKSKNQYQVFGVSNAVIKDIFVEEGMTVKKGDPIFQMDNSNLKIATENARLNSSSSDFQLNKNKLADAEKAIELAAKRFESDSLMYSRQKNLWDENIGSKIELEQKELNYENSKLSLAQSKTNYTDLKRRLKLESEQSKNNLEIAQLRESDFLIRSEVDGIVYKINKEKGEILSGQEPGAIIGTDLFLIELNIDENDIIKIKKGQRVFVRMDSYKSQLFEAKVTAIDPMMNLSTRSFQAEAIFTKEPDELFPNLTVEASIVIQTKENVLTIPRNYLVQDSLVLLQNDTLQKVEVGLMDYDLVEIKSGIDKNSILKLPEE